MKLAFLTAEWRKLAIANYIVDPAILKSFLPYKTEIDLFDGNCFVSLVGFRFINTKLKGFRIPFHQHFEEINLRFYVRYKSDGVWKRGVTFIKEIVPKRALSFVANTIYKEKYVTMPMRYHWDVKENEITVKYEWRHKQSWNHFEVTAGKEPFALPADSSEEFITEHYWGYTHLGMEVTSEYEVKHPRWSMYPVTGYSIETDFSQLYGSMFKDVDAAKPYSVMLAEGSEIAVNPAGKIRI